MNDIRRITRKQYGAEEKIRIVLDGLRGEGSIAAVMVVASFRDSKLNSSNDNFQQFKPRLG